jgi:hypothetical protein
MIFGLGQLIINIEACYLKENEIFFLVLGVTVQEFYTAKHMQKNGTKMESYLHSFHNKHKGCRALILGSGYSLNDFDFRKITENDIIFACNQAITVLKHCNYFCMTDGAIPEVNFFEYGASISDNIAFCDGKGFRELPAVINQYEKIKEKSLFFNRRNHDPENVKFDLDDGLLIVGTDVIHPTAHLAYIMGCSPLVLIGVDLNYDNGKKYCENTEFKNEIIWSMAHARPIMWPMSKNPTGEDDPNLMKSFEIWKAIKKENENIKFLNVNPRGRLSSLFDLFIG